MEAVRVTVAESVLRDMVAHLRESATFKESVEARAIGGVALRQMLVSLEKQGLIRSRAVYDSCEDTIKRFEI